MFLRSVFACFLTIAIGSFSTAAFAGKMELSTYYPAPDGEYKGAKASHRLTIPLKTVGTNKTLVKTGEIWVEACPAGTTWNRATSACV